MKLLENVVLQRAPKHVTRHALLIAYGDSEDVRSVAAEARCRTLYYGFDGANDLRPSANWQSGEEGLRFSIERSGEDAVPVRLGLSGRHNILNALAVRDPDADPITDKKGNPEPDSDLRDNENVPLPPDPVRYEPDPSERLATDIYVKAIEQYVGMDEIEVSG